MLECKEAIRTLTELLLLCQQKVLYNLMGYPVGQDKVEQPINVHPPLPCMKDMTTATMPPPKEATMVCPAALAANRHWLPVTPKVLPELKASHPLLIMRT